MNTLNIFLEAFLPNLKYILPVLCYFFLSFIVGFVFFRTILDEKKWYFIFPSSMILGIFLNILFLAVFSYFFKGPYGILIINLIFGLIALFVALKNKELLRIDWPVFSFKDISVLTIWILFSVFMLFIAGNNTYGGDVITYWGFATSFANGNYPVMSPWQPDLLANHHQGGYLYEGAIFALTQVNISLIHTIFSYMVIVSGFLFVWGFIRHMTGITFSSIIPALVFYISFSAIFIPLPSNLQNFLPHEVSHTVETWPIFTHAKNRLGGSSNLNEVFYINHRAAAFAGMFLILFLTQLSWKIAKKWQLLILPLLILPVISSDEVVLPVIVFALGFWWSHTVKTLKVSRKAFYYNTIFGIFIFMVGFFVVGSALRDSLLTPSADLPRFHLVFDSEALTSRLKEWNGAFLTLSSGLVLYLPSLFAYLVLALLVCLVGRKQILWMFLAGVIGVSIAFFIAEHTYYPGNLGRFLHLIYLLLGVLISCGGVLFTQSQNKINWLSGILLIILFVPGLFSSSVYLAKAAKSADYPNFKGIQPDYDVLSWIQKNLPQKRIFFVDGYLIDQSHSYLSLTGVQQYALIVPISPADYKVHTMEFGPEAVDVMYTVNPNSLSKLKVEYLFIARDQYLRFPADRLNDFKNRDFFELVYTDSLGDLFLVKPLYYKQGAIIGPKLTDLPDLIEDGSTLYLDYPNNINFNLRAVLSLYLRDLATVYTIWGPGGYNYIETRISLRKPENGQIYDYLLLGEKTNPAEIMNHPVQLIWQLGEMRLYEKTD